VSIITAITPTKFSLKTASGETTITNNNGQGWLVSDLKNEYTLEDLRSGLSRPVDVYFSLEDIEKNYPQWIGVSLLANDKKFEHITGKIVH